MSQNLSQKLAEYLKQDDTFRRIFEYTRTRLDAATNLTAHNFEHARRDTLNSIMFGEPEGADMHILLCAAVMHDIGYLYGGNGKSHGAVGADKLAEYLADAKISLSQAEFDHIAACIRTHKGAVHGVEPATIEAKVLADADHLEKFGPIGVYQFILSHGEFRYPPEHTINLLKTRADVPFFTATATNFAKPIKAYAKRFGTELETAYVIYQSDQPEESL